MCTIHVHTETFSVMHLGGGNGGISKGTVYFTLLVPCPSKRGSSPRIKSRCEYAVHILNIARCQNACPECNELAIVMYFATYLVNA